MESQLIDTGKDGMFFASPDICFEECPNSRVKVRPELLAGPRVIIIVFVTGGFMRHKFMYEYILHMGSQ